MGKSTIHVNECHACRGHDLHGKWFPSRARATLSSKQRLSMKYIYIYIFLTNMKHVLTYLADSMTNVLLGNLCDFG